jgi:hypothetical protein
MVGADLCVRLGGHGVLCLRDAQPMRTQVRPYRRPLFLLGKQPQWQVPLPESVNLPRSVGINSQS